MPREYVCGPASVLRYYTLMSNRFENTDDKQTGLYGAEAGDWLFSTPSNGSLMETEIIIEP